METIQDEREREITLLTLGGENLGEFTGVQCSICQAGYSPHTDVAVLKCKHVFHLRCVERWFDRVR